LNTDGYITGVEAVATGDPTAASWTFQQSDSAADPVAVPDDSGGYEPLGPLQVQSDGTHSVLTFEYDDYDLYGTYTVTFTRGTDSVSDTITVGAG
jgi:hypothetical protein